MNLKEISPLSACEHRGEEEDEEEEGDFLGDLDGGGISTARSH